MDRKITSGSYDIVLRLTKSAMEVIDEIVGSSSQQIPEKGVTEEYVVTEMDMAAPPEEKPKGFFGWKK